MLYRGINCNNYFVIKRYLSYCCIIIIHLCKRYWAINFNDGMRAACVQKHVRYTPLTFIYFVYSCEQQEDARCFEISQHREIEKKNMYHCVHFIQVDMFCKNWVTKNPYFVAKVYGIIIDFEMHSEIDSMSLW